MSPLDSGLDWPPSNAGCQDRCALLNSKKVWQAARVKNSTKYFHRVDIHSFCTCLLFNCLLACLDSVRERELLRLLAKQDEQGERIGKHH